MENDGSLNAYAGRKYENHHGHPCFREEPGILGQREGVPFNNGEKVLKGRRARGTT